MNSPQKFDRCLVLSGGGTRFAYYLGIHAAAEAYQRAPDLLLASCGGAIAGAIIQGLPDSAARKQWAVSRQMYDYLSSQQVAAHVRLIPVLRRAMSRYMRRCLAAHIPDLYSDYLVDISPDIPLPPLCATGPALAIVAGRLLFDKAEVGMQRQNRALFAEVLMGNESMGALLEGVPSPVGGEKGSGGTVAPALEVMTGVPLQDAVRLSLADIFYAPCQSYRQHHYCGGVIDLYPLELARALAREVAMELKPPFSSSLAIPALRAVFGCDGNARLRHVHLQPTEVRIDTSDMERVLVPCVQKKVDWLRNRIRLIPPSYEKYVALIEAQWQYGYSRGLEGYGRPHTCGVRPRLCLHHNWSAG